MRAMMDDLGLSAETVGSSSIFTGDEEVFAFARAVVRCALSPPVSSHSVMANADRFALPFSPPTFLAYNRASSHPRSCGAVSNHGDELEAVGADVECQGGPRRRVDGGPGARGRAQSGDSLVGEGFLLAISLCTHATYSKPPVSEKRRKRACVSRVRSCPFPLLSRPLAVLTRRCNRVHREQAMDLSAGGLAPTPRDGTSSQASVVDPLDAFLSPLGSPGLPTDAASQAALKALSGESETEPSRPLLTGARGHDAADSAGGHIGPSRAFAKGSQDLKIKGSAGGVF